MIVFLLILVVWVADKGTRFGYPVSGLVDTFAAKRPQREGLTLRATLAL